MVLAYRVGGQALPGQQPLIVALDQLRGQLSQLNFTQSGDQMLFHDVGVAVQGGLRPVGRDL